MKTSIRFLIAVPGMLIGIVLLMIEPRRNEQYKTIERLRKDSIASHKMYLLMNSKIKAADTLHENCIRF